ncbi:uncharacterized protein LOC125681019 [Ostrea edulis]|uniref:uncharacterized protein LOC125681019 n=1 Tax=Ostrea edulis TaxID=37623 RepID=UPI0024AEA91B|nr:uncharacterized protein LOC125681019 [Ostrea edulis]
MKMSFVVGVAVLLVANIQYGMASSSSTSGAVYTRWGRWKCREGATLVYSGFAGGSHYLHRGGAVEPICLPENPQWGHDHTTHAERGFVYGAEYETRSFGKLSKVQNHDVPCAVCEADGKKSVIVIPARKDCIEGGEKNTVDI